MKSAKSNPTPEQEVLLLNLAAIIAGLQVPMSIGGPRMLGAAYEPTVAVRTQLCLFGYPDKDKVAAALRKELFP